MGRKKKTFTALEAVPIGKIARPATAGALGLSLAAIEELAGRLERDGQLNPVLLHRSGRAAYRIISGRRRYLAAHQLGWETLDCLVLDDAMAKEIAVIQRLQGGSYNPWELADTLASLRQSMDWTQAHLGAAIDKSRDFVATILAITQISPEARQAILSLEGGDRLTSRHLRYVARSAPANQVQVATKILTEQLSTTRLERERHSAAPKTPTFRLIGIRQPPAADSREYPATYREWRRYYRQLNTDLSRIERQEKRELARSRAAITEARLLQQQVRKVVGEQRRLLEKERRQARKRLEALGGI